MLCAGSRNDAAYKRLPNYSSVAKAYSQAPLRLPTYKGLKPRKLTRFLNDVFELNTASPEVEDQAEIRNALGFWSWHIGRYQTYMSEYKDQAETVADRCQTIAQQRREEEKRKDEEQGALDKPFHPPGVKNMSAQALTYSWFACRLESMNPSQIVTREIADRELGRLLRQFPKGQFRSGKTMTSADELSDRLLGHESRDYWSCRKKRSAEIEEV
ncbi:MAG: hypothetical protein Q9159_004056 [Coniocarpon cinnabarinum]